MVVTTTLTSIRQTSHLRRRRPLPTPKLVRIAAFDDVRSTAMVRDCHLKNMRSTMYIGSTSSRSRRKRGRRRAEACPPAVAASMKALIACGCLLGVATVSAFRGTFAMPPRLNVHDPKNRQNDQSVPSLSGWASYRSDGSSGILLAASATAAATAAAPINRGKRSDRSTSSSIVSSSGTCRSRSSSVISTGRAIVESRRPVTRISMVAVMEPPSAATRSKGAAHASSQKRSGGAPGPTGAATTSRSRRSGSGVREMGGVPPAGMANPITPVGLTLVPTSSTTSAKGSRRRGKRRRGDEPGAMARVLPERSRSDRQSKDGDTLQPFFASRNNGAMTIRQMCEELRDCKILSRDEEYELGTKIQALMHYLQVRQQLGEYLGRQPLPQEWADACSMSSLDLQKALIICREAKVTMVRSNLRMVIAIAKRYQHFGVPLTDLIQEGSMGLIRAVEKFDPERGFKLSTYSAWWIQQAVFKGLANQSRVIRLPMHVHNLLVSVWKVEKEFARDVQDRPSRAEIAEQLEMPEGRLKQYLSNTKEMVSFEVPMGGKIPGSDPGVIGDTVEDPETQLPETETEMVLLKAKLRELVWELPEDERELVALRFGLIDGEFKTVAQVAHVAQTSRKEVRKIESKAMQLLRDPLKQRRLKEFFKTSRSPLVEELLSEGIALYDE